MSQSSLELAELTRRMDQLEVRNRFLVKTIVVLWIVTLGVGLLESARMYTSLTTDTIRAREFSLEQDGRKYASLQIEEWKTQEAGKPEQVLRVPALQFYGADGVPRVRLYATNEDAKLWLARSAPAGLVILGISKEGAGLLLGDPDGTQQRCEMGSNAHGCGVMMFDQKNVLRAEIGFENNGSRVGIYDAKEKPVFARSEGERR